MSPFADFWDFDALRGVTPGRWRCDGLELERGSAGETEGWVELLANIRRLASIVLDRLEEGSRDKTVDQAQLRLLGSIALRSLRLWQQVLTEGKVDQKNVKTFQSAEHQFSRVLDGKAGLEG